MAACNRCGGSGYLDKKSGKSSTWLSFQGGSAKNCPKCHGSGTVNYHETTTSSSSRDRHQARRPGDGKPDGWKSRSPKGERQNRINNNNNKNRF